MGFFRMGFFRMGFFRMGFFRKYILKKSQYFFVKIIIFQTGILKKN